MGVSLPNTEINKTQNPKTPKMRAEKGRMLCIGRVRMSYFREGTPNCYTQDGGRLRSVTWAPIKHGDVDQERHIRRFQWFGGVNERPSVREKERVKQREGERQRDAFQFYVL